MRRDTGAVLINALVIVLAISTIAAALLTRAELARKHGTDAQAGHQLALYLDGIELLMPALLESTTDGSAVHRGQPWARAGLSYPIDRGQVAASIDDLQGRLNVNWLMRDDPYVQDVFAQVFSQLHVPQSLLTAITDYLDSGGSGVTGSYLSRDPPVLPRGGPLALVDELREVDGMTPDLFAILQPVLAALPMNSRINLNTAPDILLQAVLAPLPAEVVGEVLNRETAIQSMSELRQRTVEILETEDIDDLPFDRMTVNSNWFVADLTATLDGLRQRRRAVFFIDVTSGTPINLIYRWAVYD
ncbi:MAG: type II secretion system minor pseudopilin GspK [Rhodobacter sp.]|nr:type II secretion system minor pseudopilin GspK [Rhodobacter sp.]